MLAEPLRGESRDLIHNGLRFDWRLWFGNGVEPLWRRDHAPSRRESSTAFGVQQGAFRRDNVGVARSDQAARLEERCQSLDCVGKAVTQEVWRIDDASVVVRLCAEHAFQGAGVLQVSGERWATRTRADELRRP
ncbi:MAG: hypothetical protein AUH85_07935 [Chloroflexi bacterium 13_1_40CM_4_68_4]|nr:MAG: hypothetical protein AUH85_07935 [Chloroflexi bacterium 13_1_40CM_4_68_4]